MVLGGVVLLGSVRGAGWWRLLAPGFDAVPGKEEMTVLLTRIMLPFLPLVSFAAVAMGMLNAQERYGPPALAPAIFNVGDHRVGPRTLWALGFPPATVARRLGGRDAAGRAAQFLVQVPPLWRDGLALPPEWAPRDPGIRAHRAASWARPPWAWPRCRSTSS